LLDLERVGARPGTRTAELLDAITP
jgi:hypothetical protein